jgi:hypothetical protein
VCEEPCPCVMPPDVLRLELIRERFGNAGLSQAIDHIVTRLRQDSNLNGIREQVIDGYGIIGQLARMDRVIFILVEVLDYSVCHIRKATGMLVEDQAAAYERAQAAIQRIVDDRRRKRRQ